MLRPLIKYTGGKYKEYLDIKEYFPVKINNYYEPFIGGGGVFFRLNGEKRISGKSYINDFSESLIEFYECVPLDSFKTELDKIADAWDFIKEFGDKFSIKYGFRFGELMWNKDDEDFITDDIRQFIKSECEKSNYNTHGFSLPERIVDSLNDKLSRFKKKDISIDETDVPGRCISTGICQAFYFIVRDMYNDWNNKGNKENYTKEERSAQWVFIREFCFGSMFRFGPKGDFNVPYGGFSYNSKDFRSKIDNITSCEVKELFRNTDIRQGDFADVLNDWEYQEDDFIFLDPPYDSIFTDYDGNSFNRDDHKRLAECLKNCKCKWLMAIGETDFIRDLYKDYHIIEYDKTYMYQARGEYDSKHTKHIVITNYDIETFLW